MFVLARLYTPSYNEVKLNGSLVLRMDGNADFLPTEAGPAAPPRLTARPAGGLADRAHASIRAAIQDGTLEPGRRIPELDLCAWLGMSRTPVREALRRLQSEGMIEHVPRGLAVARHDQAAVTELYDIRESLEGTAAALAARRAQESEVRLLEASVASQRALPDDPLLHARYNKQFHEHVYRAAHNRFLLKSLQGLHDAVALLGRTTFAVPGRMSEAVVEHAAIVAAIARQDEAAAETLARQHVRRGFELRMAMLPGSPAIGEHG